jgi:hypothetical protein
MPIASGFPQLPYGILVTVTSPNQFTSGYVVVLFKGRPGEIGADLPGSIPVLGDEDVYDNPKLTNQLQLMWNSATSTYTLRIGKTPLGGGNLLHVTAFAVGEIHVLRVLLFDE